MTRRHVDPGSLLRRAVQHHAAGLVDEAERDLRRVVKLDRRNAEALQLLGRLLAERGRDAEALPLLRRSLDLRPDQPAAQLELGALLRRQGDRAGALAALRRAAALDPRRPELHQRVGWRFELLAFNLFGGQAAFRIL